MDKKKVPAQSGFSAGHFLLLMCGSWYLEGAAFWFPRKHVYIFFPSISGLDAYLSAVSRV